MYYRGLTPADANGKCLGNSLKTAKGFEYVTNSPYGALACKGFTTKVLPPGQLKVCGADQDVVVYLTDIPLGIEGDLYASIEQGRADGAIQGMTSSVKADNSKAIIFPLGEDCSVIS